MGDRPSRRPLIDVVFALAVVGLGVGVYAFGDQPPVPHDICTTTDGGPRYTELLADGRITIAAVFGELRGGPNDHNAWSTHTLAAALRGRGFVETAPSHYEAGELAIDIALHPDDEATLGAALTDAFATHELVYYNGHSYDGALEFALPTGYRVAVLDSCWTTQHYSKRLIGPTHDVIANSERAVTGSIGSFLVIIDGLRAHRVAWQPMLEDMNARAADRARVRAPVSRFKLPEHYRLDSTCHGSSAGQQAAL